MSSKSSNYRPGAEHAARQDGSLGNRLARWSELLISALLLLSWAVQVQASSLTASDNFLTPLNRESLSQDSASIGPGLPIERELKGGDTHSFRLHIEAGQFLYAIVDQRGIDVVVTLIGPDGQPFLKIDSPNSNHGPEPLVAIAQNSGDYRIDVSAPNKNARAGRYEIRIVALREPTSADRAQIAAEKTFWDANKLRLQRTAASSRAAIETYKQALPFFQSAGDSYRQALTLEMIAVLHAGLSEFQKALEYYEQALPLFRTAGDKYQESSTLNGIGGVYDVLGNLSKALECYGQAVSLLPKGADPITEGAILSNIGKIYNDLSAWQKALEYYRQAVSSFRAVGEKRREAITLNNIGVAYASLGERNTSLEYSQQALLLQRNIGDKVNESKTLTTIGQTYALSGDASKALEFYGQALPLRKAAGDRLGEALTLEYMGMAYSALGEQEKALDYHQQALDLGTAVGDLRGKARTLNNLGYLYTLSRQWPKAADYYNQALPIFQRIGDRQNEANALYGLARTARSQGNFGEAEQHIERALSLFEDVRVNAGSDQVRASYLASKQDAYQFDIDLLMEMHRREPTKGLDAVALQTSERARARSLLEMLSEAHADIRQGLDPELLEREQSLKQQLNAKAQRQVILFGQQGSQDRLAQLNRELNQLEDEYQQLQAELRKKSPAYAALTQPQPIGLKEIQKQLDPGTLLLEYSLGEERSYVWAVSGSSFTTYELPRREDIEKNARVVYDLLTARSQSKPGENPQQKLERVAQTDSQLAVATAELSKMVIGPVAVGNLTKRLVIVPDGALQYVPFSALSVVNGQSSVPPGPGPNNRRTIDNGPLANYRPLIQDFEIVSLPSASVLAVQREVLANRKAAPDAVAVVADPVFSADDERFGVRAKSAAGAQINSNGSANTRIIEHVAEGLGLVIRRLKFTRQEANQILAEAPRGKNFSAIDFQANRATATGGELSKYRYIHFATHGYIDSEHPDLSAIVLSLVDQQGKPQDGFLRAHEIYNLNLPAELVVLSACETGLGKEIKGEGLVGLTRGFMYAGARRVVVSLWNVNDKATAELMARFYRGMLRENKTPAAALRTAQLEMSRQRQWQSPYYWAAFVLQGEWK
jgi:CHAT domain-containing protein/tetratricopeptide (TPR) repeat protein